MVSPKVTQWATKEGLKGAPQTLLSARRHGAVVQHAHRGVVWTVRERHARISLGAQRAAILLSEGAIACHGAAKGDAVGYKGWGAIAQIRGAERRGATMVALRGVQ